MQISLRQARRVEREIGAQLEIDSHGSRGLGSGITVTVYENLEDRLKAIQEDTIRGLAKATSLIEIRATIRKAIESANETSGINQLMNYEAQLKARQKLLTAAMTGELSAADREIAVARHAALKAAVAAGNTPQSRYGEATDGIALTAVLTSETMDALRENAKKIQRALLETVDKLSALNASSTITIADYDIKTLEEHSIIV